MQTSTTALIPHATGRLRRRSTVAQDHAAAAVDAVNWLAGLAGEISDSAAPSLMFVQGEPVIVDTADFTLIPGTEAVVIRHDGSLAIDTVEHRPPREEAPFYETDKRRGLGPSRPSSLPGCRAERPGVTIIGRVIARAMPRLAA